MGTTYCTTTEDFRRWATKLDEGLDIDSTGLEGEVGVIMGRETPDKSENSRYVKFLYSIAGERVEMKDLIREEKDLGSEEQRQSMAVEYLNSYLERHEALANPQITGQFRLYPLR